MKTTAVNFISGFVGGFFSDPSTDQSSSESSGAGGGTGSGDGDGDGDGGDGSGGGGGAGAGEVRASSLRGRGGLRDGRRRIRAVWPDPSYKYCLCAGERKKKRIEEELSFYWCTKGVVERPYYRSD